MFHKFRIILRNLKKLNFWYKNLENKNRKNLFFFNFISKYIYKKIYKKIFVKKHKNDLNF